MRPPRAVGATRPRCQPATRSGRGCEKQIPRPRRHTGDPQAQPTRLPQATTTSRMQLPSPHPLLIGRPPRASRPPRYARKSSANSWSPGDGRRGQKGRLVGCHED
ncbi:hypothetical protein BDW42DRAFT_166999 [Aspergillus taichungensis]|uniref:Uncharacterized protein n=1 Tax=Aspergillus taichungensis TaxID=482145 RepID=A0A2J5HY91_9EURO|nr:hypothetical protein BDW42DRAFT_166999 [Aspergillus taichungensis]